MDAKIKQAWQYPPVRWAALISVVTAASLLLLPGLWMGGYGGDNFMPHIHCWLRDARVTWLHVLSDSLIGLSYLAISLTLGYIVYRAHRDIPFHWMFIAFGLFIVTCGFTHFMAVINVWKAYYWLQGDIKAITAVASVATAVVMPATVPRIFALIHNARMSDQRQRDLAAAHEKLKESEELKSQFFANVSHELRTPLSLIIGPVRRRLAAGDLGPAERADLEVAARNASLLLQQVNNLLDLAKIEADGMKVDYAQTDLAELTRRVASYFESLAAELGITFEVNAPESLPAQVDPDKVQRVFLNLLSNAFKFTPEGGNIRCSIEVGDDQSVFVVEDSGPGIPEPLREVVFERFRQVEGSATRKVGGTGLGLPIAREFVKLHGGSIALTRASAGGARFEVRLPLRAPQGTAVDASAGSAEPEQARDAVEELRQYAPQTALAESASSVEHDDRPLVLVVEDNPDMNAFIVSTLEDRYRVASASNGQEGLDTARRLHPELIVSDIMMPQMSGDQMIARLQHDPRLAEIPVVVLTAKADERQRVQLLEQSVQDHLTKPFQADELLARVGGIIHRRRETMRKLRELNASLEQRVAERTLQVEQQAEQLRRLAADLNATEQRERRHLAQVLHDHLQQLLVGARMGVERVAGKADPESMRQLEQVERTLDQSIQVSRSLTVELYPPVLYDRGLGPALHWLAQHVTEQHGLQVRVSTDPAAEPVGHDLQAFLFSAVRELLLNVVKHAKVDQAGVTMQRRESNIVLTVEDKGRGCTPEQVLGPNSTGRFGLFNIRERLRVVGGSMSMQTAPEPGCRIELECPLEIADYGGYSPSHHSGGGGWTAVSPNSKNVATQQKPIRVMIVDDHKIMREGLNGILEDEAGIQVVAEAADGREAIELIEQAAPDVIIMDVSMPRMDGVATTQWIMRERPHTRVIGLSMHAEQDLSEAMLKAGAWVYLTKGCPSRELVDAIRRAGAAE